MDMRISNIYNVYSAQAGKNVTKPERVEKTRGEADKVSLSAQAGDYQTARNAVAGVPDIRENIVNRIQEMLDAGTYHVSAHEVAARIFVG
ncbi:MAG: flagellar biosynthesis anti-sigma factor FlgM [Clostridiales bacterium]|nr:flagellar biosynthesis anti-sigma factor FlgM [Clostridiales bacterium]